MYFPIGARITGRRIRAIFTVIAEVYMDVYLVMDTNGRWGKLNTKMDDFFILPPK